MMNDRKDPIRRRGLAAAFPQACVSVSGALLLAVLAPGEAASAELRRDPRAVTVADAVTRALAGEEARDGSSASGSGAGGGESARSAEKARSGWDQVAGLKFDFTVVKDGKPAGEIHHLWAVRTGQYRVQWKGGDGNERLVIFNVGTREGRGWMREAAKDDAAGHAPSQKEASQGPPEGAAGTAKGAAADGGEGPKPWAESSAEALKKLLDTGYGRFINDTYWLLMPLKMKDPGVNLDYDGEKSLEGETYDIVKLSFDGVGLTPGDTYWVYVNRSTHRVERWEYVLQGDTENAAKTAKVAGGAPQEPERSVWLWKGWKRFGPLELSTEKDLVGDQKVAIIFKNVEVLTQMPAGSFDLPAR